MYIRKLNLFKLISNFKLVKYLKRFALILFEIIARRNPFEDTGMSSKDILERIFHPQLYGLFRPNLKQLKCENYITKCVGLIIRTTVYYL